MPLCRQHRRRRAGEKEQALTTLNDRDLVLSVQVLQEFYVQATRFSRTDRLEQEQAMALVESWLRFPVQELSYWDAAIVEAARESGCLTVLSEDLQDGMDFAGVRVMNPFR